MNFSVFPCLKISRKYLLFTNFLSNLKREKDFLWLNEVSSVCLQQSLRDFDISYINFFKKRPEFPKFKNKHSRQSIRLTKLAFSWDGTHLKIAQSNRALNIRISRQFLTFLKYKSEWYGRNIVALDHYFSDTQKCSACSHKQGNISPDIRIRECSNCKIKHNRDFNASYNIYRAVGNLSLWRSC